MIGLELLALLPLWNGATVEPSSPVEENSWTVYADMVYTAAGNTIEGGIVTIKDGKITSVTKGGKPGGEDSLSVAAITPGMIDLSVRIHGGATSVEQSNEIQPHRSVESAIDLYSHAWDRQVRSGVTTTWSIRSTAT